MKNLLSQPGRVSNLFGDAAKQLKVTKHLFTRWEDYSSVAAAFDAVAEKLKNI